MIWVVIGITIAFLVLGTILFDVSDIEAIPSLLVAIGAIGLVVSLVICIHLCVCASKLEVIDDKIAMYQEENAKIEEQISEVVKQYQQFETNVFTEIAPDSSMTLIALYPELKSDVLVQSQIDVYIKNNETIKNLKETQIDGNVVRWWLYLKDGDNS